MSGITISLVDQNKLVNNCFQVEDSLVDCSVQKMISWVLSECPDAHNIINFYGKLTTSSVSNQQILTELAWIVYAGGFKYDIIRKYWERISGAFLQFDVSQVALLSDDIDEGAEDICRRSGFKNMRKAKWCIQNAQRIEELEIELRDQGGLRGYFVKLSTMGTLEIVNIIPTIMEELNFKGIGKTTIFHLLKNVGIDIFKPDIHVCRILNQLGLIEEKASMLDITRAMCALSAKQGIKVSELDTLLFIYGKTMADNINI